MAETTLPNADQLRFLVVDDQPFIRQIVRQALASAGVVDVENARNGADAIEKIRSAVTARSSRKEAGASPKRFDCVIMDLNMDPLNGIYVLKAIRTGTSGAPRDTPVVILTAHSDDNLVAAGLALDANEFIIKPVSRDGLLSRVRRATSRKFTLKPKKEYAVVEVPEMVAAGTTVRGTAREQEITFVGQAVPEAADQDAVLVRIDDIAVGIKLAAEVRDPDGVVVIRRSERITQSLLRKIADLRSIDGIADELWVWR